MSFKQGYMREARASLGLTQASMAKALGVSISIISKIESNVSPLTLSMSLALECLIRRKKDGIAENQIKLGI